MPQVGGDQERVLEEWGGARLGGGAGGLGQETEEDLIPQVR